ncbi:cell envelope biogenesis protein TonB [Rhodopseudomonas palustris]|uniref:energy transducer TonB family protein n=1 Tax=Rhodopseudomonas palustris TaxID=1076 RepID=UPI000D1BF2F9|nr:energy transducer TonB [Rhodopseudomonas palustris]AVT76218.1 cell envelope biogenesis protein TonB [Rhodopseudomonas palustris]
MNARALHDSAAAQGASRWLLSAAVIVGVHAVAVAAALAYYAQVPPPGEPLAAIMIDLAPMTASPQPSPLDLPPGPEMQEAEAPQSEPEPVQHTAAVPEIAPTPIQQNAEVPLPPEAKPSLPDKPEAVKLEKPEPAKPKPERPKPEKRERVVKQNSSDRPPAPRTSAPQRAERRAADAMAALAGAQAAAAMLPSYRQRLAAHLQRFKRYPTEARASGVQGTATLSFTVGRGGQVLSARLARSSGHPALDAETLAMVSRAQPLPPFPPEITQASLNFSVPVNFSVR